MPRHCVMYSGETLTERGRATLRLPAWALGEQRLARMAARGERHAFEALFTRYHRELYHYCRAIVGEPRRGPRCAAEHDGGRAGPPAEGRAAHVIARLASIASPTTRPCRSCAAARRP